MNYRRAVIIGIAKELGVVLIFLGIVIPAIYDPRPYLPEWKIMLMGAMLHYGFKGLDADNGTGSNER
jgi:hypothetical protein